MELEKHRGPCQQLKLEESLSWGLPAAVGYKSSFKHLKDTMFSEPWEARSAWPDSIYASPSTRAHPSSLPEEPGKENQVLLQQPKACAHENLLLTSFSLHASNKMTSKNVGFPESQKYFKETIVKPGHIYSYSHKSTFNSQV